MDGEMEGAQATGEEQQGQQGDQTAGGQQPQGKQQAAEQVEGVGVDNGADDASPVGEEEYRAALADRDRKITELEAQIAEATKSVESAKELAKQIEVKWSACLDT